VGLGLVRRGHSVEIFTQSDRDETFYQSEILVYRVKLNTRLQTLLNSGTHWKLPKLAEVLAVAYALRSRVIQRHRQSPFDIVQSASYRAVGIGLAHACPIPLIVRLSSYEKLWREINREGNTKEQQLIEWLELYACRHSSAVYAPSQLLANILDKETGLKVDVIQTPFKIELERLDDTVFEQNCRGFRYLLFFGTICFLKGVAVLAEVLGQILPQQPDLHMVFVGKVGAGPVGLSMMEYVYQKAGPNRDRIHYLGVLPHEKLYPVISGAESVVLPSLVDNLPNACLESMALGRVVIGTKSASFEEIIEDGKTGFLVHPGDTLALANAIKYVWRLSDDAREEISESAKDRVSLLDPRLTCAILEDYFQKLLLKRRIRK
jgi:glycosyltransferase involved in cell wall biosynthesis